MWGLKNIFFSLLLNTNHLKYKNMKKIILGILVLIIAGGGYVAYQLQKDDNQFAQGKSSAEYYQNLRKECEQKTSKSCCLASVEAMKKDNAHKINGDVCSYGYKKESMLCVDSFTWCKPLTINETSKEAFYQNLKDKCELKGEQKSCCLDSVKVMEVVGATKLLLDGKETCEKPLEPMALRCPGSYAWCQTLNNPEGDDFVPVPIDTPRIEPNQPKNPSPGFDSDGNGQICTLEAKSCGDGTYVGRTGPNCEFEKCPGKTPEPDFVPTKFNQIQLPNNVITEKECALKGGEVWNTLGETSYDGELIGKIEGLKCPCACLVRSEESDKIWVNVNGNMEEFKGNLNDIQTFDDCKKAGFQIKDGEPEICIVGEPHMTGGKYKTFYNNPIEAGKTCQDYHYSNCPGSCVAKCVSSSCSEPDENGAVACTSDCDGAGSCVSK